MDEKQVSFENWLKEQPDDVQTMIAGHISGLTSALKSEREARSKFEKDLTAATKQLEEGSTIKQELEKIRAASAASSSKATFYEKAHGAGAKNLRLLHLAAQEAGAIREDGSADFEALKKDFSELFGGSAGPGPSNAGSGNRGGDPEKKTSMDDLIRARMNG